MILPQTDDIVKAIEKVTAHVARRALRMLRIATAAVAPLIAVIITTAATRFFFHARSAKKIVPAVVATFKPSSDPLLPENAAAVGFASCAPALSAADVL